MKSKLRITPQMSKRRVSTLLLLLSLSLTFCSCALPSSSPAEISVVGRLTDSYGRPLQSKAVEVVLPAEYGLNNLDSKFGVPKEQSNKDQSVKLTTDSLGSFTHTFSPAQYSETFWLLPPLGSFPKSPPEPFFLIRFPERPKEYYQVMIKDGEAIYKRMPMVVRGNPNVSVDGKPIKISGVLKKDSRNVDSWIADLQFQVPRN